MVTKNRVAKNKTLVTGFAILLILIFGFSARADQPVQQPINQISKTPSPPESSQPQLAIPQTTISKSNSISADQQLYTIELQVTGESEEERKQSFANALEQVLIKNSNNQIITLPTIKTALTKPDIYIQRYTYIKRNNLIGKSSLFLQIQFDQASITKLLEQVQIATASTTNSKSQTLVWLVTTGALGNQVIVDESSSDTITSILRKNAQDFGISIMLPVSDLQDVNRIKIDDICNLNATTIKNASNRYGVNIIVAGCLKQPSMGNIMWSGRWLLLRDNRSDILNFTGATAENVIMQTMRAIGPIITKTEKPPINQTKKLIIRITNVKGLEQYNEVVRYLIANSQITQVDLVKIGTTEIELSVSITSDQQTLLTTLATQNKLIRNTDTTTIPPGIDLDYKWVTINNEQTQATSTKPVS